jgi:NADPH-dependent ferric siderophore reductase
MREDLIPRRVRHPLVLRTAQVVSIAPRGDRIVRITFRGPELIGFVSDSFDDHVKVFFPAPGQTIPHLPQLDPSGQPRHHPDQIARDYTPRRYDPVRGELDIEFVLHGDGPGTRWAAQAYIGQTLGFGGPRGSNIIPTSYDWHWLIADETGLPAISRRLEELQDHPSVMVVLLLEKPERHLALPGSKDIICHRLKGADQHQADSALLQLLDQTPLPPGEGFAWAAGELDTVRAIRAKLLEKGLEKTRIRASSYWRNGTSASHQTIED